MVHTHTHIHTHRVNKIFFFKSSQHILVVSLVKLIVTVMSNSERKASYGIDVFFFFRRHLWTAHGLWPMVGYSEEKCKTLTGKFICVIFNSEVCSLLSVGVMSSFQQCFMLLNYCGASCYLSGSMWWLLFCNCKCVYAYLCFSVRVCVCVCEDEKPKEWGLGVRQAAGPVCLETFQRTVFFQTGTKVKQNRRGRGGGYGRNSYLSCCIHKLNSQSLRF